MKKKKSESLVQGKLVTKKGKYIPHQPDDSYIDFSDIPELSDEQLKSMKRVGRPLIGDSPKAMIAIRLDTKTLGVIRQEAEKKGTGYQTLINTVLKNHFNKKRLKKAG